jgi:hypothetical protein
VHITPTLRKFSFFLGKKSICLLGKKNKIVNWKNKILHPLTFKNVVNVLLTFEKISLTISPPNFPLHCISIQYKKSLYLTYVRPIDRVLFTVLQLVNFEPTFCLLILLFFSFFLKLINRMSKTELLVLYLSHLFAI